MADRKISALSALTAPATGDYWPIVDISESAAADQNKRITFGTALNSLPDGSEASPSLGWLSDSGDTGLYRSAADTLAVSVSQTFIGAFQSSGFQLGTGTAAAQLHLFSTDTTDQVIIENTDAGTDTAPDLVLFRNSASPANSDNLGQLIFRGEDSAGNTHEYAAIAGGIQTVTNTSEDGILDLMSSASGTLASRIRLRAGNVGINESAPSFPLHLTTAVASTALQLECSTNDASSGGDITLFRRRGASGAGQDNDLISTLWFRGKNDASTPEQIDYACIQGAIGDASDGTEDGELRFRVEHGGTLTTYLTVGQTFITIGDAVNIATNTTTGTKIGTATGQKIAFWNATPVDQPAAVTDLAHSTSSGTLPTADGTVNISNAASPTNAELLTYCVELEAKLEALLARIRETGLIAT